MPWEIVYEHDSTARTPGQDATPCNLAMSSTPLQVDATAEVEGHVGQAAVGQGNRERERTRLVGVFEGGPSRQRERADGVHPRIAPATNVQPGPTVTLVKVPFDSWRSVAPFSSVTVVMAAVPRTVAVPPCMASVVALD